MRNIVNFSGGKDSTAMLLIMIEEGYDISEIIFCDTGVEFPDMYEHITKVENYINKKVTRLKADKSFEYYLGEHLKRNGKVGYGWPDFRNRWCTWKLKKQIHLQYIRNFHNVVEFQGISYDERERVNKNKETKRNIQYPLVERKITGEKAIEYCYSKGFDWGGLYRKIGRVGCYCCPLARLEVLFTVYKDYPDLWENMKKMNKKSFRRFRYDYTIDQLEDRFKYNSLWDCKDYKKIKN